MDSLILPLRALLDPVGAIPRAVASRRWVVALTLACLTSAASGAVIALKLDAARVVLPKMEAAGELMKASEREISEAVEQAQRVALVGGVAKGLLLTPLLVLALAVVLKIAAWLIGRKALFADTFTVAALTMLPLAVFHSLELLVALRQVSLSPAMIATLLPTSAAALAPQASPKLMRVLATVDLFNCWAALVMGLGFAVASKWQLWKGALFGLLLYVLFAGAFLIGLPGLAEGLGEASGRMGGS